MIISEAAMAVVASVSSALLGVGLAVVAVLPIALDMLSQRQSKLELRFSTRRLRGYFTLVPIATLAFALSVVGALVALVWPPSFLVALLSFIGCVGGICLLVAASIGVSAQVMQNLKK